MSMPCPNCSSTTRIVSAYNGGRKTSKGTLTGVLRTRLCARCGSSFDTIEVRSGAVIKGTATDELALRSAERERAAQAARAERDAAALAAGKPRPAQVQCPFCNADATKGTIRTTLGHLDGEYLRHHRCKVCARWFYTGTDVTTGAARTITRSPVSGLLRTHAPQ